MRTSVCLALVWLIAWAGQATAESVVVDTGLSGDLRWVRTYVAVGEYTDEGGPVSATVQIPADIDAIQSMRVRFGGEWYEGCFNDEFSGSYCGIVPLYIQGPCVSGSWAPAQAGPGFSEIGAGVGCDLNSLIGAEITIEAWAERVDQYPTGSWWSIPYINLYGTYILLEVETTVPAAPASWSALNSRYERS